MYPFAPLLRDLFKKPTPFVQQHPFLYFRVVTTDKGKYAVEYSSDKKVWNGQIEWQYENYPYTKYYFISASLDVAKGKVDELVAAQEKAISLRANAGRVVYGPKPDDTSF